MEEEYTHKESIFEKISEFGKTSLLLTKLSIINFLAKIIIGLISKIFILIAAFLFMLTLNIALAVSIGEYFNKLSIGFYIVALFYFLLTVFFATYLQKFLINTVGNMIIKTTLDQHVENE
jgi:hypothetical protein